MSAMRVTLITMTAGACRETPPDILQGQPACKGLGKKGPSQHRERDVRQRRTRRQNKEIARAIGEPNRVTDALRSDDQTDQNRIGLQNQVAQYREHQSAPEHRNRYGEDDESRPARRRAGFKTAQTIKPEPRQGDPARFSGGDKRGGGDRQPEDQVVAGHGLRGLAKQERHSDKARDPNKNADSERVQDRALNRALRDRLRDPLENPV